MLNVKLFNFLFLFELNAHNMLNKNIYHLSLPTSFAVCYTAFRETVAFFVQELHQCVFCSRTTPMRFLFKNYINAFFVQELHQCVFCSRTTPMCFCSRTTPMRFCSRTTPMRFLFKNYTNAFFVQELHQCVFCSRTICFLQKAYSS